MHAPAKTQGFRKFSRTKGEVYVWISSMGLTIGLAMVLALLLVILVNGVTSFWPAPVARVQLLPESEFRLGDARDIAGEMVKKQRRRGGIDAGQPEYEMQFFTANRDVYGTSFKYIPMADIEGFDFPKNLVMIERMEYGNAVGYPTAIQMADGTQIDAESPDFVESMRNLTRDADLRRKKITRIERTEIGRINSKMTDLRIRERSLNRSGRATPEELERIAGDQARLQEQFEELASSARILRDEQTKDILKLRLVSGQELNIAFGDIVDFYFPNNLGIFSKLGLFLHNFWYFLSENPREANTEGGIFPAIFGTFVMTLLMSIAVMPFGVVAAIYLREYAAQGLFVRAVRIAVNNLAGVPSIVFGVFGLGFFVYFVGGTIDSVFFSNTLPTPTFGTGGIFWASLTLALMTVPVVIVATEEALAAVPRGVREGSLACGASKWQTIQRIVLPAAAPGILTGLILAMARGAGEVAPLMLVGVVKLAPSLPIDGEFPFVHLERKFMHLGFHIFDLGFQSPDSEAARPMVFATTLLLILLVVILNFAAIILRERLRKKYATAAF